MFYVYVILQNEGVGKQIFIDVEEEVTDFKVKIEKLLGVPVYKQRLIYRSNRQIEDGNYMVAFDLKSSEIIVLLSRSHGFSRINEAETYSSVTRTRLQENEEVGTSCVTVKESDYYRVGDLVDFLDQLAGCWYEGKITRIYVDAEDPRLTKFESCEPSINICSDRVSGCAFVEENFSKTWCVHLEDINESCGLYNFSTNNASLRCNNNILRNLSNDKVKCPNKSRFINKKHFQTTTPKSKKTEVPITLNESRRVSKNYKRSTKEKKLGLQDNNNWRIGIPDNCIYKVENLSYFNEPHSYCELYHVRPRAYNLLSLEELREGQIVMVNYNLHDPEEVGLWFDAKVISIINTADEKFVIVDLLRRPHRNVKIWMTEHIYEIEESTLLLNRNEHNILKDLKRPTTIICELCRDSKTKSCKKCGCCVCGGKPNCGKMILCDGDQCQSVCHFTCFQPPLTELPDDWSCAVCNPPEEEESEQSESDFEIEHKEIRQPIQKCTKKNSTTSYTISKSSITHQYESNGTGKPNEKSTDKNRSILHTISNPKIICPKKAKTGGGKPETIEEYQKPDHTSLEVDSCVFGPIPGISVGTVWHSRVEAAKAGVHKVFVSGIHGKKNIGAFSIILSHGYENDDQGNVFWYIGSGKDEDQELTGLNRCLALNCNAPVDDEKGAESTDWKQGKPVRVLRSFKGAKTSKFAPKEGVRYDGIYKVVKYKCVKGASGFNIWKFFMQRDDETPPPWDNVSLSTSEPS